MKGLKNFRPNARASMLMHIQLRQLPIPDRAVIARRPRLARRVLRVAHAAAHHPHQVKQRVLLTIHPHFLDLQRVARRRALIQSSLREVLQNVAMPVFSVVSSASSFA